MRISAYEKLLFRYQMDLLDAGVVTGPAILAECLGAICSESSPSLSVEEFEAQLAEKAESLGRGKDQTRQHPVKNVVEQRNKLVKAMMDQVARAHTSCKFCKMPSRSIRAHQHNKIFFSSGLKRKAAEKLVEMRRKKREEAAKRGREEEVEDNVIMEDMEQDAGAVKEEEEEFQKEMLSLMEGQVYITQAEIRKDLHQLWANDGPFLKSLIGALDVSQSYTQQPFDVFFVDVIPVIPSKFRPVSPIDLLRVVTCCM